MGGPNREHQNRSSRVVLLQLSHDICCKVTKAAVVVHKALKALQHHIYLMMPEPDNKLNIGNTAHPSKASGMTIMTKPYMLTCHVTKLSRTGRCLEHL